MMERLTNFQGNVIKCIDCVEQSNCESECDAIDIAINRLKEYEDLNLTPTQIQEIDKLYAEKCKEVAKLKSDIEFVDEINRNTVRDNNCKNHMISTLKAEVEQLKAELEESVKLHCKVGDIVYSDSTYFGILAYEVNSIHICCGISFEAIASRNDEMLDAIDFDIEDIGKTVFLKREEAEKVLAEMESEDR